MTTQKINGVYCVSNALGGGMKNVSRTRAESQSMNGEVSVLTPAQPEEIAQKLETFNNEKPVLMPAQPETKQVKTDTDADARQALLFAIEHLVHHSGAHVKIEITI